MHSIDSGQSISVVIVSDYERTSTRTWQDERLLLEALARQDIDEPFEVLLIMDSELRGSLPDSVLKIVPGLKTIFLNERKSSKLKDYGVKQATTEYVAVLEADCVPCLEWLRLLSHVLRTREDVSVVSGRTWYGQGTMLKRSLSLLDRGFDDLGQSGSTIHVSNNGALYRRAVLAQFPYPDAITPFYSAGLRNQSMVQAGHRFYFEREAVMRHAIGGWHFVKDFRRNSGYSAMMLRAACR